MAFVFGSGPAAAVRVDLRGEATRGKGEEICRHDLAHYGSRAKTSARLVGTPFRYASRGAGFEPLAARRLE